MEGSGKVTDVKNYLRRIAVEPTGLAADLETLNKLQRQHLLNVPFENLDIHWKRPIVLNVDKFYAKIVEEKRGGFCYELNGSYRELLAALGFVTRLLSGRVFNGTGHGREFDHAAVIVAIGDDEYLTDVGFGDFTVGPLRLELETEQHDETGTFVIRRFDDEYLEVAKKHNDVWKSEYIFKNIARDLSEFEEMCDFQQFSSDSHFTKGKVCSLLTDHGRKTLTDKKFIITVNGEKTESEVSSEKDFSDLLKAEFGLVR